MAIDRAKITKQAENYMASGKVERAIDEFLKLLDDKPDDFNLMNRIGDAYVSVNKLPDAVDLFKRAAMGWERGGFNNKAIATYKKASRHAPDDVDLATRLADLYRQANMIKDAVAVHIQVAEQFQKKGLIKRALEEFAKVVDLDPKNLKNKVKLADLYNKEGMKDRAAGIYLEVAETLAIEQMHTEAYQILERAKSMVSTPQVFLTQSRLCVIQKDLAGAAAHLREGLTLNPRSNELLEALAEVEIQSKNPERALEALIQIPQLPEKALTLCERALRELVRLQRADEGLRIFKPVGRELARRGMGDMAARTLKNALHGAMNAEAWLQLAEIAQQSGNRAEQGAALRNAYVEALQSKDQTLAASIQRMGEAIQLDLGQITAAQQAGSAGTTTGGTPIRATQGVRSTQMGAQLPTIRETTDLDPVKRMQIQQLEREAENYIRNRFNDRALDNLKKVLEIDPVNEAAIHRIADIHKAGGILTKVQMHYVQTAQRVAELGRQELAVDLLDKAEAMFPGSTRLFRRQLGLMGVKPPAPVAPLPETPLPEARREAIPMAPPQGAIPPAAPPAEPPAPMRIALDLPEEPAPLTIPQLPPDESFSLFGLPELEIPPQPAGKPAIALPPPPDEAFPPLELEPLRLPPTPPAAAAAPPAAPPPAAPVPAAQEPAALQAGDLDFLGFSSELEAPAQPEPLVLEPLQLSAMAQLLPDLPEAPLPIPEIDEELESVLSDIDFQLDYGNPEEAKNEIENALKTWPQHPELQARLESAELALRRLGMDAKAETEPDFSHSFFDLTDVLGDALLETGEGEEMHDATHVVEKIQSVDELFNAFREGVEQQVKVDDYETHYNLGIAYKEMMLIEPAIEEFQKAMNDPERTLECCSMLSICEASQGNLDAAIAWLRKGIDTPGFPPEDSIGLRYDMGTYLEQMGKADEARTWYRMVHDMDPDYREVAQKLG